MFMKVKLNYTFHVCLLCINSNVSYILTRFLAFYMPLIFALWQLKIPEIWMLFEPTKLQVICILTTLYNNDLLTEFMKAIIILYSYFQRFGILELQNRVTQNDVTLQVTNSKMFTEILL